MGLIEEIDAWFEEDWSAVDDRGEEATADLMRKVRRALVHQKKVIEAGNTAIRQLESGLEALKAESSGWERRAKDLAYECGIENPDYLTPLDSEE